MRAATGGVKPPIWAWDHTLEAFSTFGRAFQPAPSSPVLGARKRGSGCLALADYSSHLSLVSSSFQQAASTSCFRGSSRQKLPNARSPGRKSRAFNRAARDYWSGHLQSLKTGFKILAIANPKQKVRECVPRARTPLRKDNLLTASHLEPLFFWHRKRSKRQLYTWLRVLGLSSFFQ